MSFRKCLELFVLALIVVRFAWAGEEKVIPLDQIPAELWKTTQDMFPDATFSSADIETEEDGTRIYEVQGRMPDGLRVELDLHENGDIEEYEIEFTEAQVPGAVMNAVSKKVPGFRPTYIEASHSRSGKVIKYEMEGTLGDQELDIEVSADGRRIEVSDK